MAAKRTARTPDDRTTNGRTRFTVRISEKLADYIDAVVAVGIHGSSNAEVARKFIENEVERLIREGIITKIAPPKA